MVQIYNKHYWLCGHILSCFCVYNPETSNFKSKKLCKAVNSRGAKCQGALAFQQAWYILKSEEFSSHFLYFLSWGETISFLDTKSFSCYLLWMKLSKLYLYLFFFKSINLRIKQNIIISEIFAKSGNVRQIFTISKTTLL